MLGSILAAWLAISGGSIWWLTWMAVGAIMPDHEFFAVAIGLLGFVMGLVVLALADEVAQG